MRCVNRPLQRLEVSYSFLKYLAQSDASIGHFELPLLQVSFVAASIEARFLLKLLILFFFFFLLIINCCLHKVDKKICSPRGEAIGLGKRAHRQHEDKQFRGPKSDTRPGYASIF